MGDLPDVAGAAKAGVGGDAGVVARPVTAFPAWYRPAVALLLIVLGFAMLGLLLYLSENRENLIMLTFGGVSGYLAAVINFTFGSSQGSAAKQDGMEKLLERGAK